MVTGKNERVGNTEAIQKYRRAEEIQRGSRTRGNRKDEEGEKAGRQRDKKAEESSALIELILALSLNSVGSVSHLCFIRSLAFFLSLVTCT